jgi:hypothetical protein
MIYEYTCSVAVFYGDATTPASYYPAGAVISTQTQIPDPLPPGYYSLTPGYSTDYGPPIVQLQDSGNHGFGQGNSSLPPWATAND